jgi:hypothetical protein
MGTAMAVDVLRPGSWPKILLEAVASSDGLVGDASISGDLRFSEEASDAVNRAAVGLVLATRHFTRLLSHEIESIASSGLALYSRQLFDERIDRAVALGYIEQAIGSELKAITIPAAEQESRGRREFVCMIVGEVFEYDPASVAELITNWGGEGIYFAAGALPYKPILRLLGRPCVVHVNLSLADPSALLFWPPLEKLLLASFRGLPEIGGDVFSSRAIPSSAITAIEELEV